MQILTLTNCPLDPTLGSGRTVLRFSEGLRNLGHRVHTLAPVQYEWHQRFRRAKRLRQALGAATAVSNRLRRERYDLLEFYGGEFWPAIVGLPRSPHRPFVVAHTNGLELIHLERARVYAARGPSRMTRTRERVSRAMYEPFIRRFFKCADGFVALCEADRRYVVEHGLFPEQMTAVIEPGLDDEFHQLGKPVLAGRADRVCFLGTWTARKGITCLVDAMTRVLRSSPGVVFDVFGAQVGSELVASAFPIDVRGRVVIHPTMATHELANALSRGKVYFSPSEYEGYGMALAEAMACGLAVVTTPTGLGADLAHGAEAFVFDFGDVEAMTSAILRLLRDDDLRWAMARRGWQRVHSLRWDSSIGRLEATYRRWAACSPDTTSI